MFDKITKKYLSYIGVVPSEFNQNSLVPANSMFIQQRAHTPPILRRSRRRMNSSTHNTSSDLNLSEILDSELENAHTATPVKNGGSTPIKQLPFSPSQFFNSPNLTFDVTSTSTPVKKAQMETSQVVTPIKTRLRMERDYSPLSTPSGMHNPGKLEPRPSTSDAATPSRSSRLVDETPRTPTPFKKALADIEKRSGPIKTLPDTPTRLEDITEIMKKDQDTSNYETDSSAVATVYYIRGG